MNWTFIASSLQCILCNMKIGILSFTMEIVQASLPNSRLKNRDICKPHPSPIINRLIFIYREFSFLTFFKINFDGNVTGITTGAEFIICDPDSRLFAVGGTHLIEISVPSGKLMTSWKGIIYARPALG